MTLAKGERFDDYSAALVICPSSATVRNYFSWRRLTPRRLNRESEDGRKYFVPKPNLQPGIKRGKIRGQKQTIEGCLHKSGRGYGTILKESIRFRAEKENSFIQKIKLLGM